MEGRIVGQKRTRVLGEEEKQGLLGQFNSRYRSSLRNLCLIRLMLESGLRCGEVISLEASFFDPEYRRLTVRGARARDRVVPLDDDLIDLIHLWLNRRPQSRWLFCTGSGGQLDARYVRGMVKRYAKKAGISDPHEVSPRTLRHTYAADLYAYSRDVTLLQRRLGHSYRSSTVSYIKMVVAGERRGCASGLESNGNDISRPRIRTDRRTLT